MGSTAPELQSLVSTWVWANNSQEAHAAPQQSLHLPHRSALRQSPARKKEKAGFGSWNWEGKVRVT